MKILIAPYSKKCNDGSASPKDYPYMKELVKLLEDDGHLIIQIGVEGEEQLTTEFLKGLTLDSLEKVAKYVDLCISVDSFFPHFCWKIGVGCLTIFGVSSPTIYGHPGNINIIKDITKLKQYQFQDWRPEDRNTDAWFTAKEMFDIIKNNLKI